MRKTRTASIVNPSQNEVMDQVEFQIYRDDLITSEEGISAQKDFLMRNPIDKDEPDEKIPVGIISKRRNLLLYPTVMETVWGALKASGVKYHIQESSVNLSTAGLFQKYIIEQELPTPDGQVVSPMMVLQSSHIGKPLDLKFGTYRFVCSNGAVVGEDIGRYAMRPSEVSNFSSAILQNSIVQSVRSLTERIGDKYQEMYHTPFEGALEGFLIERRLPSSMKIRVLRNLEEAKVVSLNTNGERLTGRLFEENPLMDLVEVAENQYSTWNFYQMVTNDASTAVSSNEAFSSYSSVIANVFGM
jgi:hypothetical protein